MTPGERAAIHKIMTALEAGGWSPAFTDATDDGSYEPVKDIEEAIESVEAVDSCTVTFTKKNCRNKGILFVLGNDPSGYEVAADWSYSFDKKDDFDSIVSKISDELIP